MSIHGLLYLCGREKRTPRRRGPRVTAPAPATTPAPATRTVTVNSRNGEKRVETALTLTGALGVLLNTPDLGSFGRDLCDAWRRDGAALSAGRQAWLFVLAQEELDRRAAKAAAEPATSVGDFGPVAALFARAKAHLKHPRIKLDTASGRRVVLTLAGARSRYAGSIMVTD